MNYIYFILLYFIYFISLNKIPRKIKINIIFNLKYCFYKFSFILIIIYFFWKKKINVYII